MLLIYLAFLDNDDEVRYFEEIYSQNYNKMLWKAMSILHNRPMAEDIVQEAFFRLLKNKSKYFSRNIEEIGGLCLLMVKHMSVNKLRDEKRESIIDMEEDAGGGIGRREDGIETDILNTLIEKEEAEKIREIINLLPENYSTVLTLFYGLQYNCGEIASMLGVTRHAVEMRLYRGRIKLEKLLKEYGYGKE